MTDSNQNGYPPAYTEKIRDVLDELPKDNLIAVVLFGSAATGKLRPLSDIDLCLVTRPGLPVPERTALYGYGSPEIHISLFSDLPPAVRFRVFRDGIVLYCSDPLLLHRARVATVHEYCDIRPMIDRQIARILG